MGKVESWTRLPDCDPTHAKVTLQLCSPERRCRSWLREGIDDDDAQGTSPQAEHQQCRSGYPLDGCTYVARHNGREGKRIKSSSNVDIRTALNTISSTFTATTTLYYHFLIHSTTNQPTSNLQHALHHHLHLRRRRHGCSHGRGAPGRCLLRHHCPVLRDRRPEPRRLGLRDSYATPSSTPIHFILTSRTAPTTPTNNTQFISICEAIGQQAKCCLLPILGQALICSDVNPL